MRKTVSFLIVAVLFVIANTAQGTVRDTIRIGDLHAYYFGDGVFRVPVFLYNDNDSVMGINLPFRYVNLGDAITPDSVTHAGRTAGLNTFDAFLGFASVHHGTNPDSTYAGFISIFSGGVGPGDGVIADMWFSGGQPGDLITFNPVDNIPPGGGLMEAPEDPDGGLIHRITTVLIVDGGFAISCGSHYYTNAAEEVAFPISVMGGEAPYTLEILSLGGSTPNYPDPVLTGEDPWQFSWTPGYYCGGQYTLCLRATDALDETVEKNVIINVTPVTEDPGDFLRGDLTCDGKVDIADLVYMVDWMFNSGPPPECNPEE